MKQVHKPLIAVFPSHDMKEKTIHIRENYVTALTKSGGVPFLVPVGMDPDDLPRILSIADGFFFSGGGDVAPARYGEEPHPRCGVPDPDRDRLELAALAFAWETGRPIFAVCRGIQLLNVALGGTLYQDLPAQLTAESAMHHQEEPPAALSHTVTLCEDAPALLRRILKADDIKTNSFHHQAVRVCPPELAPAARTPDGVIEAVSARDETAHPFALGVQWHPEHTYETDDASRQLFRAFIAACRSC